MGQPEDGWGKPGGGLSPGTNLSGTDLNLDFSASRSTTNKFLLFIPLSLWYFLWYNELNKTGKGPSHCRVDKSLNRGTFETLL